MVAYATELSEARAQIRILLSELEMVRANITVGIASVDIVCSAIKPNCGLSLWMKVMR
jgi:hypothetical protein